MAQAISVGGVDHRSIPFTPPNGRFKVVADDPLWHTTQSLETISVTFQPVFGGLTRRSFDVRVV